LDQQEKAFLLRLLAMSRAMSSDKVGSAKRSQICTKGVLTDDLGRCLHWAADERNVSIHNVIQLRQQM